MITGSLPRSAFLAGVVLVLTATGAVADSMTWLVRNDHPNTVALAFYATETGGAWPSGDEHYVLDDGEVHEFPLSCETGETICYGAWLKGDPGTYWGAGMGGDEACDSCCTVCDGGETPIMVIAE